MDKGGIIGWKRLVITTALATGFAIILDYMGVINKVVSYL